MFSSSIFFTRTWMVPADTNSFLAMSVKGVLAFSINTSSITVAYVPAGKYNIFCKVRAKDTSNAKDIIYQIDDINGVSRTETMISLEESINDKKRMMHAIFKEL